MPALHLEKLSLVSSTTPPTHGIVGVMTNAGKEHIAGHVKAKVDQVLRLPGAGAVPGAGLVPGAPYRRELEDLFERSK